MRKVFIGIVICLSLFTRLSFCQNNTNLNTMKWLIGTWSLDSKTEKSFEEWNWVSDTLLKGKSYAVSKKDTTVNEMISIIKTNEGIFYKAEVNDQNNGQAIYFKLINIAGKSLTFENKTHDFPKIIRYKLLDKKNLSATIEGDSMKYEFKMTKIR